MTHMEFSHPYFGVFVMFVLSFGIFLTVVYIARVLGRKIARLNTEKLKTSLYECGPEVTKQPSSVSIQFYLMALLFILFDIEIIFMFPWAINFQVLGWFGFVEMILFILLLTIGFIYAWKKGALEWHNIK
ncbi:NAD(P)H-quinone oxidoreductase subunit 3 [Halarcobacter bivalviorum]|uniref:NADH-quinone oxidoreductase subunit A n=1 Tax=Halarcobacter bivalviorum TaxID=663364 RepID=A0AAX2A8E5_9BACT|nr:NAD(P)H-quinone oxidoreductase subunit 3 [Halarcobacter bivalviorum]AXH13496.1 NADH:quinone oxidoreductase I, membrane subunit A [Halarcobacter bivalviorum]RXK04989.1 NADH-quinone oxidoreductase subunit A [Halarcobacter bivalviorum]RXK09907.1 NADH-quinone oxidoreductase subunit A [Halarcobacter bivalviorum]